MRRAVVLVILTAAMVVAGILAPPLSALAGPRIPSAHLVVVQTVPSFEGVKFSLNGRPFVSNSEGIARVAVQSSGFYSLTVHTRHLKGPGERADFSRWGDDSFTSTRELAVRSDTSLTRVQAGYEVSYIVRQSFADQSGNLVDTDRVRSLTLTNSLGGRYEMEPNARRWLPGARVTRARDGLHLVKIPYSVRSVLIDGANVVNQGQQRFFAEPNSQWRIELLFYRVHFVVHDRLFGFPMGSRISLEYPDGHAEVYALGAGGSVELPALPRGQYMVVVHGFGVPLTSPIALSRDQDVSLAFLSWFDLAAAVLFVMAFVLGLPLIGRRRWRQQQLIDAVRRVGLLGRDRPVAPTGLSSGESPEGSTEDPRETSPVSAVP